MALAQSALLLFHGSAQAASFDVLHSFCQTNEKAPTSPAQCEGGSSPWSRLLQIGSDFYGTTESGGTGGPTYSGTVFRLTAAGAFKVLHNFCTHTYCADGGLPGQYLARGTDGNIYGVAQGDGSNSNGGTIFKVTPAGDYTTVYRLCSQKGCLDGYDPNGVTFDFVGDMFGTTDGGGAHDEGTVFEITAAGTFRKLHDFCAAANCADGLMPGALLLGKDGNFYGTTKAGGRHQAGTVFRITPTGTFTTLYSFCPAKDCPDGKQPNAALVQAKDGNFYGTTLLGGAHTEGTVFQMTPAGAVKTLHSFCTRDYCRDGSAPMDGLIQGADGRLYGTTNAGGSYYHGVLFAITTAGSFTAVHDFCSERGCFDGASPAAAPILGADGNLYGAATAGGDKNNVGAIYRLTP